MEIIKSKGVTRTEQLLAQLCDNSFLKLWSYANPFNDKKKELCDLLAVFENNVFIFFDREKLQLEDETKDPETNWERWKRKVIEPQIRTENGTERYLRNGGKVFLDKDLKQPFPIPINNSTMVVHKIVVAHGAKEACLRSSEKNVSGSLGISYSDDNEHEQQFPFWVQLDKNNPVHIFDSNNLQIIFSELDTFFDFTAFLDAKIAAIHKFECLMYCGEEDLLANYFLNYDEEYNRHYIGMNENNINALNIGEGEWKHFIETAVYKRKKEADKISYFWDELIQRTCENALTGKAWGNSNVFKNQSAICEMAKEPRFFRRILSDCMINAISNLPENEFKIMRKITFIPSFYQNQAYVFLQLKVDDIKDYENDYRPKRQAMLEIACGAAKNKFHELTMIIGIAIDAPKFTKRNSEDFILLNCKEWTEEDKKYYEERNEKLNCFKSENIKYGNSKAVEFPYE